MFAVIANRQINTRLILGAEGLLPGQSGRIKLYLDPLATTILAGAPSLNLEVPAQPDKPVIAGLGPEDSEAFRRQWQQTNSTMSAGH